MSWPTSMRVAAGMLIGLALGSLPFLRYGAVHHHDRHAEHADAASPHAAHGRTPAERRGHPPTHGH